MLWHTLGWDMLVLVSNRNYQAWSQYAAVSGALAMTGAPEKQLAEVSVEHRSRVVGVCVQTWACCSSITRTNN
jgi:hypothetical protein